MKRGELSMEVIIIAAIALLVLVILSVLIIRAATNTSKGTGCEGIGGTCQYSDCKDAGAGYSRNFGQSCPEDSGGVCCVQVSG